MSGWVPGAVGVVAPKPPPRSVGPYSMAMPVSGASANLSTPLPVRQASATRVARNSDAIPNTSPAVVTAGPTRSSGFIPRR